MIGVYFWYGEQGIVDWSRFSKKKKKKKEDWSRDKPHATGSQIMPASSPSSRARHSHPLEAWHSVFGVGTSNVENFFN